METHASTATKFLDIFVIIQNNAFMPEIFTMLVDDVHKSPQYPRDIKYPALPIGGLPVVFNAQTPLEDYAIPSTQKNMTPSIFYLDEGIMLFFRVPVDSANLESMVLDNYYGPSDFVSGGSDVPPFLF